MLLQVQMGLLTVCIDKKGLYSSGKASKENSSGKASKERQMTMNHMQAIMEGYGAAVQA